MPSFDDLKKNIQKKQGLGDLQSRLGAKKPVNKPATKKSSFSEAEALESQSQIEVSCDSIDEGLSKASAMLGVSRINLDYDIIQKGSAGFLGMGKKPFVLRVAVEGEIDTSGLSPISSDVEHEFSSELEIGGISVDGSAKVIVRKSGIFFCVTPAGDGGSSATLEDARTELARKGVMNYDLKIIKKIVDKAKGTEEKIGKWVPNPQYDSRSILEISDDEMKAMVTVTAPILSGRVLEPEEIVSLLENNGVKYGISHEKIKELLEKEIYNVPVVVAEGDMPKKGKDAHIVYHFKTKHDDIEFEEEEDGSIDFKKTDLVQNVVAGQILATKTPATKGEMGRTVTNVLVPSQDGKDIDMRVGKNVTISPDGLEAQAKVPGQAVLLTDKIDVEEIYEVNGDVSYTSGNIVFLGTVIVKGSVEDEFSVKAAGNIIVKGEVGKAELEAEGDIIISKGVLGKDAGKLSAGGSIYAKFLENVNVSAGVDVVAKEGILHSRVDAGSRVICNGKRAAIQGGKIRAGQEINSKIIGAPSYNETICEAGVDPKTKERLEALEKEHIENEETLNKLIVNVNTLQKQKEASGSLTPEKENMLNRMLRAKKEFTTRMKEVQDEVEELRNYLATLENTGKVSAKVNFFPGTLIRIKNAEFAIKQDFKFSTFVYEAGYIKPKKYEPIEGFDEDNKYSRR
jgi:uncharacterized protein (DUF342 family)